MAKKFQSTHPRGVRRRSAAICAARISFQSTHPRGVRRTARLLDDRGFFISIHAPARGATHRQTPHAVAKQFQSTHPRGVRRVMSELLPLPGVPFQSTHPRGVRRAVFGGNSIPEKFQSTHPRGVRPLVHLEVVAHGVISIHAPARGATGGSEPARLSRHISIHAPARGATRRLSGLNITASHFNPRTREGCDCGFIQKNKRFSDIPLFFLLRRRSGRTLGAKTDAQAAYSAHACQAARPTNRRSGAQPPENARSSPRFRCEPLCDLMNASPSHYRMSGSSGRYACLQPKCSILLSYFFPR